MNLKSTLLVLYVAVCAFGTFSLASAKGLLEYKNTKDHHSIKYPGTTPRVKAYFFCVKDIGYVITSTAKDSTFKIYEKQFDEITNTFKTN